MTSKENLPEAVKSLIKKGLVGTQEEIVDILTREGYDVNQSKISRLLRKLLAVKIKNDRGETIYTLPKEPIPPSTKTPLTHLVLDIAANENLVVIQTSPGSASLIARMLDYHETNTNILATIAGDNTIFVAPKSANQIKKTLEEVKRLLATIS
ncbi:transcriptional regulator ArgR [Candidiatus Paracoxiella cheracis]|uniref:transcriptional regulator ArgR n=1 Tax=Candidiatus Paracoxiella cheracis TaxID=3405120 RepID=UPI003BF4CA78